MTDEEAWKLARFVFGVLPLPLKAVVVMLFGGYLWLLFTVVLPAVLR